MVAFHCNMEPQDTNWTLQNDAFQRGHVEFRRLLLRSLIIEKLKLCVKRIRFLVSLSLEEKKRQKFEKSIYSKSQYFLSVSSFFLLVFFFHPPKTNIFASFANLASGHNISRPSSILVDVENRLNRKKRISNRFQN